jgi:acetyltransferase
MAIVAEAHVGDEKRLVAVGRLVGDADHESAEFAVLVEDEWQGKGLGSLLTRYCVDVGKAWGIHRITAETTADNHRMQAVFKKLGFELIRQADASEWIYRKLFTPDIEEAATDTGMCVMSSAQQGFVSSRSRFL